MLKPDFNIDEYYQEYNKVKHIPISEYPDKFKKILIHHGDKDKPNKR